MKIVINRCYGGYGLSKEAYKFLGLEWDSYGYAFDDDRTNTKLIECVEQLKEKANGSFAKLQIARIPDNIKWEINEYDGMECVIT